MHWFPLRLCVITFIPLVVFCLFVFLPCLRWYIVCDCVSFFSHVIIYVHSLSKSRNSLVFLDSLRACVLLPTYIVAVCEWLYPYFGQSFKCRCECECAIFCLDYPCLSDRFLRLWSLCACEVVFHSIRRSPACVIFPFWTNSLNVFGCQFLHPSWLQEWVLHCHMMASVLR